MKIFNLTEEALSQRCWSQYLGNYTVFTDDRHFAILLHIYIYIYIYIYTIYIYICYIYYVYSNKQNITTTDFFNDNPYLKKEKDSK